MYERAVLRLPTEQTFNAKMDLWSLGVTLYHAATGELPFKPYGGRTNRTKMYEIISQKSSGDVSGVQKSNKGPITRSPHLPQTCSLSRGLQEKLVPLLAGLMETDESLAISDEMLLQLVHAIINNTRLDIIASQVHQLYQNEDNMSGSRSPQRGSPREGLNRVDQTTNGPTAAIPSTVNPKRKFETSSNQNGDNVEGKISGHANRSSRCTAPNDGHLENRGSSREVPAMVSPQVVHHIHHFPGARPPVSAAGAAQLTDPNFVLPDHLLQGLCQTQEGVPYGHIEALGDRVGESYVHLDTTAPINIVNCQNVQLGRGRMYTSCTQPGEPDTSNDDSSDYDDDGLFLTPKGSPTAPPPYSLYNSSRVPISAGPSGLPALPKQKSNRESKQRVTGFSDSTQSLRFTPNTQTELKRRVTDSF